MGYVTISEARNYFRDASVSDMSDVQLQQLIDTMTDRIDDETGRTWQGIQSTTDRLFDGDGRSQLWLDVPDLVSITALSIDESLSGTFTTVTVDGTRFIFVYPEGYIVLGKDAEVTRFTIGNQTVKVSYTAGIAAPTEEVKLLCLELISNWRNQDPVKQTRIDELMRSLKTK